MNYKHFSTAKISAVGFGSMAFTSVYNPNVDSSEAYFALNLALDNGVNLIHTAHHYGDGFAFQVIRNVLSERNKSGDIKIISKIEGHPKRILNGKEGLDVTRFG